jgi:asparagine synthase (glutamine-hydrolysing)
MCGIAGIFDSAASNGAERLGLLAATMAATLFHRGPDDSGLWVNAGAGIALGHRRLAVIELGVGGAQPMVSAGERWVLAYNGEIYNHREVRRRLENSGTRFRSGSDTEVLLAAVEQWGIDQALEACEGMFALALWDQRDRQLHLVRDRFGEKPLYYGWIGKLFAFGSELKALRVVPGFSAALDRRAVARDLRHNCIPAPDTIYQGVRKLLPGHLVTVMPRSTPGVLPRQRSYWSAAEVVERSRQQPVIASDSEMTDQLEATLSAAVAARMVADVPVGAFLSGGIDSSTIVALMRQHATGSVRTFTVGFADRSFDESAEAAAVAAHLGTEHTAVQVGDAEAVEVIQRLPDIWDEPFADVSQIPTYLVSEVARRDVTVSLSGDGGDELFAGYNRHAWLDRVWGIASAAPGGTRRAAGAALGRIPPGVIEKAGQATRILPTGWQVRNPSNKVSKLARVLSASDPEHAYQALTTHWADSSAMVFGSDRESLYPQEYAEDQMGSPVAEAGITEQMLWLDLTGYLPDDILVKVDRAAMAVSLETRVPFLDRKLLELAWSLPLSSKLRGGTTKWLLRQVLQRHVPAALVERPKMGFGLPIGSWLRGELAPWADHLLDERRLRAQGVLDPFPVRRAWELHRSGRRDLGYELWDVLVLQAWIDRWMPSLT